MLEQVKEILHSVDGQTLQPEERANLAIQLTEKLLECANTLESKADKATHQQLARMMDDPKGKVFTTSMTDEVFRTSSWTRTADQISYLIDRFGVPNYLSKIKQLQVRLFSSLPRLLRAPLVPVIKWTLRQETAKVILPGEDEKMSSHMEKRRKQGVRVNLNHIGEAILGEKEALNRLKIYLEDLANPKVEYISVKVSTIGSQLNLLAWNDTLETLKKRLRKLYRSALANTFVRPDGTTHPKFVNLDMEEYRDLHLTSELFCSVLDEPEFRDLPAGIVLQAYLPDSYPLLQELTTWAKKRSGAPIKVRIVKGANLAMEQVEASLKHWPQAPYTSKAEVDANYKRMLHFALQEGNAKWVHIGIASHNLFDISYALLLVQERALHKWVSFEMLEGMANHMRLALQSICNDMLLYCPAASRKDFNNAVAYLIRRLDENTSPDNFLRNLFELRPNTPIWEQEVARFTQSVKDVEAISDSPRRTQDRWQPPVHLDPESPFTNEPDTDWTLPHHRQWAKKILVDAQNLSTLEVPNVIGGNKSFNEKGRGVSPNAPDTQLYTYSIGDKADVEQALQTAVGVKHERNPHKRASSLRQVAKGLRERRGRLISVMVADGGKTVPEADAEVSEAIDFCEYYARSLLDWTSCSSILWRPKGTILVASPWNFPCAIPAGGVAAALAGGNSVIFKPAKETVLIAWELARVFYDAGIEKDALQFLVIDDEPLGSELIKDARITAVILTGATSTAEHFLQLRPGLDLMAETGGKNAMIVTRMSDRDLAVKDIVHSAFGHAGQKCSACSLAILENEVYDDPSFLAALKDAAASLHVGPSFDPKSIINPMITSPSEKLLHGLTRLEPHERWLLQPEDQENNPNLWSPGIRIGTKVGDPAHVTEFFGPTLALMRAQSLEDAINIANQTPYALTGGLHSLDEREQRIWEEQIEVGNGYVNRGITGAIVERQPFGGYKDSGFGRGFKAGGPDYLSQMMHKEEVAEPTALAAIPDHLQPLIKYLETEEEKSLFKSALGSYCHAWQTHFSIPQDPSQVLGQDNIHGYRPWDNVTLITRQGDRLRDLLQVVAACQITGCPLEIVGELEHPLCQPLDEDSVIQLIESKRHQRFRCLTRVPHRFYLAAAKTFSFLLPKPVYSLGRLELLNYVRPVAISRDYHRYGNLGARELESAKPGATTGCTAS